MLNIFLISLLINLSLALKTSDICLISEKNACNEVYSFRCTLDYCTKDKLVCKDFTELNIHLNQIVKTKAYTNVRLLIQRINVCTKQTIKVEQQQQSKTLEKPCVCTDHGVKCNEIYCSNNKNECNQLVKRLMTRCCKFF